jgi:hypothetical protein
MVTRDLLTLLAALLLLPERLGKVRHFSNPPSRSFSVSSWVRVRNEGDHMALHCRGLTNSEKVVQDYQEGKAINAMTTSHVFNCSFFISSSSILVTHLVDFFENCRSS